MSGMLASVMSLEEADTVVKAKVDILDLKQPEYGALGALEPEIIRQIVEKYATKLTISATIGDIPFAVNQVDEAIKKVKSTGVDIIKVGVFGKEFNQIFADCLRAYKQQGCKIVLVFFPDLLPDYSDIVQQIDSDTVYGAMLDTANKQSGSLLNCQSFEQIQTFLNMSASKGLVSGLAGSLGIDDIHSLLLLEPDYLGFRGAICEQSERTAYIDELALYRIRKMI